MTIWYPHAEWNRRSYEGPLVAANGSHPIHTCSVFYPLETAKPPRGWPLCVIPVYAGFRSTSCPTQVDSDAAIVGTAQYRVSRMLQAGYAVLLAAIPPARGRLADEGNPTFAADKTTGNVVDDPIFDIDGWGDPQNYGPAYNGNGMIVPDLFGDQTLPTAYDDTIHPIIDPSRPNWMQAITMLCQFVNRHANAMGADKDRIIAGPGGSASATTLAYVYYGPNRGPAHFPGGTGQDAEDTRIFRVGSLQSWQPWFSLFPFTPDPCPLYTSCYISSFPQRSVGGDGYEHYDQQALSLGQTGTGFVQQISTLVWATDAGVVNHRVADINAGKRTWMVFGGTDDVGPPYTLGQTINTGDVHSVWFGGAMKTAFPDLTRLVLAGDPGVNWDISPHSEDATISGAILQMDDLISWLGTHSASYYYEPTGDRLPDVTVRSIAKWVKDNNYALDDAYVVTPDFDWDTKLNPVTGKRDIRRALPFAAVKLVDVQTEPYSVSNSRLVSKKITASVTVCTKNYNDQLKIPYDVEQSLNNAQTQHAVPHDRVIASGIDYGLPLWTGGGYSGTVNMEVMMNAPYSPDDSQHQNLKYSNVILVSIDAWKDRDATLIENVGNMPINDS